MDEKFKVYDTIVSAAAEWILCFVNEHKTPIRLTNVDWQDEEDLCLLSILSWVPQLTGQQVYYKGSIFSYWILKYIKHQDFLKKCKFDTYATELNLHEFENELMLSLNKHPSLLAEIYQEYYKR